MATETKKVVVPKVAKELLSFGLKGANPITRQFVERDIANNNFTKLTYSDGLADMLGEYYDFRFNGVIITLHIDGKPNYVPECLADIIDEKVGKILSLNAKKKENIDVITA